MAGIDPVDDDKLSPGMMALVRRFRDDPDYVNGLKIFAHKSEIAEIIWSGYVQLLDNGRLPPELKELVRIKLARNNDCSPYAIKSGDQSGNLAPMAIISGSLTQLNLPSGIAVDSTGNIYVANDGSFTGGVDTITVYSPGSNGNVAPSMVLNGNTINNAVISGSLTGLNQPAGIALVP